MENWLLILFAKAFNEKENENDSTRNPFPSEIGRSKRFGNSAAEYLKVHSRCRSEADVTEGRAASGNACMTNWSDPNHVVLTTTDSIDLLRQACGLLKHVNERLIYFAGSLAHTQLAGPICRNKTGAVTRVLDL